MRKRILAVVLVISMLWALPGCAALEMLGLESIEPTSFLEPLFPENIEELDFEEIEYKEFDMGSFYDLVDETLDLIKSEAGIEEIVSRVFELESKADETNTMQVVCAIHTFLDAEDEQWKEYEMTCEENRVEIFYSLADIYEAVLEHPKAERLLKLIGFQGEEDACDYIDACRTSGDPEESRLENEYEKILYSSGGNPKGKDAKKAAELLVALVNLRNEQAREAGYENYVEMIYDDELFSLEELAEFEEMAAVIGSEYSEILGINNREISAASDFNFQNEDEVIQLMKEYLPAIDQDLANEFDNLYDRGYFLLRSDAPALNWGITYPMETAKTSVAYNYLDGTFRNLSDSVHEFGHAFSLVHNYDINGQGVYGDGALCEVQSSGLEALMLAFYDDIYGEHSDEAKLAICAFFFNSIIGSASDDYFERSLYTTENLTPEMIGDLYVEASGKFGYNVKPNDYTQVPHFFENPLYQTYYMYAYFASSQLAMLAEEDFDAAVDAYMVAALADGFDESASYVTFMDETGLVGVDDVKNSQKAIKEFADYINKIN